MTEQSLVAEIARLQKLDLDEQLRLALEEAAELLAAGRYLEAEALVQNTEARARQHARTIATSVNA